MLCSYPKDIFMKLCILTAISPEFKAARAVLKLADEKTIFGCRTACGIVKDCEVLCVLSGPGKARAAQATAAAIHSFAPDVVIDSGTCAGLQPKTRIGSVVVGTQCFEFDVGTKAIPEKKFKEMAVPAAFHFLGEKISRELLEIMCKLGEKISVAVTVGAIACGEIIVDSREKKEKLIDIFVASAADWETAAVFISALRTDTPVFSLRLVSDLGDGNALRDFRKNAKQHLPALYRLIATLLVEGWMKDFLSRWHTLPHARSMKLWRAVRP